MFIVLEDTKVITVDGEKLVKDLTEKDTLFNGEGGEVSLNGSPVKGSDVTPYHLTFQGNNTVTVSPTSIFHTSKAGSGLKGSKMFSTKELCEYHDKQFGKTRPRWGLVDLPNTYETLDMDTPSELDIDPYTLGFLLGDGCLRTKGGTTPFCTIDEHILTRLKDAGNTITKWKDNKGGITYNIKYIHKKLKVLGLKGTDSGTKFIPNLEYTLEDKVHLLQGLMDADGCVNKDSSIEVTLKSEEMIDWIKDTIEFLGGTATKNIKIGKCKDYNFEGEYWRLYVRHPEASILFSLPRKIERTKSKPLRNRLLSYEIGEVRSKEVHLSIDSDTILLNNSIVLNKD